MKNLLLVIMIIISHTSYGQWDKKEVIPVGYSDSVLPLWAEMDGDNLVDLIGYDTDLETLFYRKRGAEGFLNNVLVDEVSLRNGKFLIADWDQDGDIDIVGTLGSSSGFLMDVRIYLNDGAGTFSSEDIQIEIAQFFGELSGIGDMDGDGLKELLIEHSSDHYLYTNNGSSYEAIPVNVGTSNSLGTDARLVDLDGDTTVELIDSYLDKIHIYNYANQILELEEEIFALVMAMGDAVTFEDMRFHDVDGDGDIDLCRKIQDGRLATSGDVGSYIPLTAQFFEFIQDNQGRFMPNVFFETVDNAIIHATPYSLASEGTYAYAIYDEGLKIFNFQNGSFQEVEQYSDLYPITRPEATEAINITGMDDGQPFAFQFVDNKLRLALASPSEAQDVKFDWNTCANCSSLFDYEELELIDLDNDGDQDVLVCSPHNDSELFWIKNYLSGCSLDTLVPILTDYYSDSDIILKLETGDLDNDGDSDLIIMEGEAINQIIVLFNLGNGSFSNPEPIAVDLQNGFELYVEDIYNDGYADIIIHTGLFSTITQDTSTFTVAILENSSGIENYSLETIQNNSSRGQLEFGDINNDGTTDLVIYNDDPFNEVVQIYTNQNGALNESQSYADFIDMFGMDLFDYDGDGFLDILAFHDGISNNNISTLYLYKNENGMIDFTNPTFIYDGLERCTYELINNEDGTNQLVGSTLNPFTSNLLLYDEILALDTLDTRPQVDFQLGDVNGDGFMDILSGNINGGLNFFTRGVIDCDEAECISDTKGSVIEMNCGGDMLFLIETEDGTLLEPQFLDGENFDLSEVDKVILNYTELNETSICPNTLVVQINCIEQDGTLSVTETSEKRFSVYPSPVLEILNLSTEEEGTFFLFNVNGQLLRKINSEQKSMDVSELNAGTYIIHFRNEHYSEVQQLIKI